jgi:predicted outer membrane repeat protein
MTGGSINHNIITSSEICSAIFLEESGSTFNMTGGELTDNGSDVGDSWGGAIFAYPQNTIIIKNATVSRNKAGAYGGALMVYGSSLTVENSTFEDNGTTTTYTDDDSRLGGAILNYASTTTITSSTFTSNKAALGGAIANDSGIVTVSNSIFTNNTSGDKGGAIYSTGDYRVTSSNNSFSSNTSNNKGGAIYSQAKQFNSTNDVITGNTALIGGGVYLDKNENITDAGSANLSTAKIYNNKATTNANDIFISANAESVQIIDMSTVDEAAEYGSDTVKTDDLYTDNAGNRYSTSNVTDVVAYDSLAASTEYSLTAAGEKIDGPTPDPDPAPDPETIPDNPPTVDEFGTYVTIISICSLGLAVAIKARK